MKTWRIIGIIGLLTLSWYGALFWGSVTTRREARIVRPAPTLPAERVALSGVWEGVGPDTIPTRVVVEEIHDQWATVVLAWRDHPQGHFSAGSLRAKAKVLPDGTLYWHYLGGFLFQLSDDWNNLTAKQDQGGRVSTVVLRHVPPDTTLATLSPIPAK